MSSIDFVTIQPDGTEQKYYGRACFSDINLGVKLNYDIEYSCKLALGMTEDKLDFWVSFLTWMLGDDRFTWHYEGDKMIWYLNSQGMGFHKALTYLTGMRYPEESPHYVDELLKYKDEEPEKIFEEMQKFHLDKDSRLYNWTDHTFLSWFTVYHRQPISIERFREHLANPMKTYVNSHFEV